MTSNNHLQPGQRVEVLWHRGDADEWYAGTMLEGGRVQLDHYIPFAPEERLILESEEIASWRTPACVRRSRLRRGNGVHTMEMKPMRASIQCLAVACLLGGAALPTFAQATSPAGLWKTIDHWSKQEKSLVRIVETDGVYTGIVEQILDPGAPKDAVCKACRDERKDQPIVGMTIMRKVKQSEDDKAVFGGGDILDPSNGKVYRVELKVLEDGSKLDVRGYFGAPMLGRSQTWIRLE